MEEQVADGAAWAEREGWRVSRVIRETGSASRFSSRRERLEWAETLGLIRTGRVGILLTWENSRATRDLAGFTELRDACAAAGVLWGYGGKVYDLATRDGRFRTGLDALLAEDEAARTSERIRRAVRANADAGRPHGRNLYGYRRVYDPATRALLSVETEPEAARVVQEAFRLALGGSSLYSIAKSFNDLGIPPRYPKRVPHRQREGWTPVAVKQMLSTSGYAGLRQFHGEIIGPASWPALVSVEEWTEVQAALARGARPRTAPSNLKHLLTGIAQCGGDGCGSVLRSGRNTKTSRRTGEVVRTSYENYLCSKNHTSIATMHLDSIVQERLLERVAQPSFVATFPGAGGALLEQRRRLLHELEGHTNWLAKVRVVAAEVRNPETLLAQERLVQPQIDEAIRHLESLNDTPAVVALAEAGDPRQAWEQLDLATKRAIIRSVMAVRVHPAARRGVRGRAQAEARTEIIWRS